MRVGELEVGKLAMYKCEPASLLITMSFLVHQLKQHKLKMSVDYCQI